MPNDSPKIIIKTGRLWLERLAYIEGIRENRPSGASVDFLDFCDTVDFFIQEINITECLPPEPILPFFSRLSIAAISIAEGKQKAIVEFLNGPW